MASFTQTDHMALLSADINSGAFDRGSLQGIYRRLLSIHKVTATRLHNHGIDLHPAYRNIVTGESAGSGQPETVMSLTYMRPLSTARTVEGIMGRDGLQSAHNIDPRRHPVIEVRITPHAFAIELVVSPHAWHDQQNLIGKLSVDEHRHTLFALFNQFAADYVLGFWGGLNVDDMHISTGHLPPLRVFSEWMGTLSASRDYFRVGVWYDVEDERLHEGVFMNEIYQRVRELSEVYDFLAWTSNNDFIKFYTRTLVKVR